MTLLIRKRILDGIKRQKPYGSFERRPHDEGGAARVQR